MFTRNGVITKFFRDNLFSTVFFIVGDSRRGWKGAKFRYWISSRAGSDQRRSIWPTEAIMMERSMAFRSCDLPAYFRPLFASYQIHRCYRGNLHPPQLPNSRVVFCSLFFDCFDISFVASYLCFCKTFRALFSLAIPILRIQTIELLIFVIKKISPFLLPSSRM